MSKILFIAPDLSVGGLQLHLVRLANQLIDRGHNVTLLLQSDNGDCLPLLKAGVKVLLARGRMSNPVTWWKISRVISAERPDLVVGWSLYPSIVLSILKFCGLRAFTVSTELNYPPLAYGFAKRKSLTKIAMRHLYQYNDLITANSDKTLEYLGGLVLKPKALVRIFNPVVVEDSIFAPPNTARAWLSSPIKILAVGRLVNKHKGFDILLKAMPKVLASHPNSHLLIVGDGPDKSDLLNLASSLSISDSVTLVGANKQVRGFFEAADIVVVPSNYEGFPNVLIEAMMCGCIVLASDCFTGPSEVIEHGKSGFLFEVGNCAEMSSQIEAILCKDQESLGDIASSARAAVAHFDVCAAAARYETDIVNMNKL